MPAKVTLIADWKAFFELGESWKTLYHSLDFKRPFQSWEWVKTWVEIYGLQVEPAIFVVRDENKIIGIVPLYIENRGKWPLGGRILRFLGDQVVSTEFQDVLTATGYYSIVWWNVLHWLLSRATLDWDFFFLDDMALAAPSVQILKQLSRKLGLSFHQTVKNVLPVLDLERDWDTWVRTHPNRDFISMTRNRARRLRKKMDVRIQLIRSEEEFATAIEIFFDLHQKNWTARGLSGSFATEEKREFYRRVGRAFLKNGWLQFRLSYLNGQPATGEFGVLLDNVYYSLQSGYDPKFRKQNMGHFLFYEIIHTLAIEGVKRVEFLRGGEKYKFSWGAREQFSGTLWVGNHSLPGFFHPFYKRQKHRIKHLVKGKIS